LTKLVYFAGLYAGSAVLLKVLGFLLSIWMAGSLTVSEFASWGLLYAFQSALVTFSMAGIVEAVVGLFGRHPAPEERRKVFAGATGAFLITAGLSAAITCLLCLSVYAEVSFLALSSVAVSGALLAFAALRAQIVRLEERHFASLAFNFGVPLIALVASASWFLVERSAESYFFGAAAGALVAIAALCRVGHIEPYRTTLHREKRNEVLVRLAPYIAIAFFGWLSGYGYNFVITAIFPADEVARFTFALSVGSVMQLIAASLNQVWSPRFFRITRSEPFDSVEAKNRRFYLLQGFALGGIAALGVLLLRPVLTALGGNLDFYASMTREVFCIFVAYILLGPWWHCQNYFLAYDRGHDILRVVLVTSVLGIAIWLALMWLFGPIGIYLGFLAQMAIRAVGIALFARRFWPVKVSWVGVAGGLLMAFAGLVLSGTV
jgi:O-antigen/teichoic acid export membrane protein